MNRILRGALIPLVFVMSWEMLAAAGVLPNDTFSRPSMVSVALVHGLADGSILIATWRTVEAALAGFAIAAVIGVTLGVVLGLSPRLEAVVGPSIEALRPVPAVALIPLTLLVFGFGLQMEAAVVAFACVWPILLVTIAAVRGVEPRLLELGRVLELSFAERMRKIILPAALGGIGVGLSLAVGIALVVAVTVEIVLNPRGLGYGMILAQQSLKPELMYAQLVWVGLLGWALNLALRRTLRLWPGAVQSGMLP